MRFSTSRTLGFALQSWVDSWPEDQHCPDSGLYIDEKKPYHYWFADRDKDVSPDDANVTTQLNQFKVMFIAGISSGTGGKATIHCNALSKSANAIYR